MPSTAISRRCSASPLSVERRRDGRHHRLQRRRESRPSSRPSPACSGASREAIRFDGEPIGGLPAPEIMKRGIAMVPEGRRLFPSLTVEENLLIGAYGRTGSGRWSLKTLYELFPVLGERRDKPSTALSGGQQQMVAIGRALMSNPRLLLCDEISLGLAPVVIRDIYAALPAVKAEGTAIVVVEQDIVQAHESVRPRLLLLEGRMTLTGAPASSQEDIHAAYFGHEGRLAYAAIAGQGHRGYLPPWGRCPEDSVGLRSTRHAPRRHHPGHPARRALRAVRLRPVADLRRHAPGQPRAWRPDRARRLPVLALVAFARRAAAARRAASRCR